MLSLGRHGWWSVATAAVYETADRVLCPSILKRILPGGYWAGLSAEDRLNWTARVLDITHVSLMIVYSIKNFVQDYRRDDEDKILGEDEQRQRNEMHQKFTAFMFGYLLKDSISIIRRRGKRLDVLSLGHHVLGMIIFAGGMSLPSKHRVLSWIPYLAIAETSNIFLSLTAATEKLRGVVSASAAKQISSLHKTSAILLLVTFAIGRLIFAPSLLAFLFFGPGKLLRAFSKPVLGVYATATMLQFLWFYWLLLKYVPVLKK